MRWYGRLRRSPEIAYVRRSGRRTRAGSFSLYAAPPGREGGTTVAIAVPAEVGGAVVRNRIRRRLRGALDATARRPAGRLFFVAHQPAATAGYAELAAQVERALAQLVIELARVH